MFFTLSLQPDTRLPNHSIVGNTWFSYDNGWTQQGNKWSKGYRYPTINHGNWIEISCNDNLISINHDGCRSFPLWWDSSTKTLTNLLGLGERIWADKSIQIVNQELCETQFDIYGSIDTSPISLDNALETLISKFVQKFEFLNIDTSLNKKLFVTGGVDTVMIMAFVKNCKTKCDIIDYDHFEFDQFTNCNIQGLKKHHWAYAQIHHWKAPVMLLTGGCGDEFFFRGPYTIALWAAWHDINIANLLKTTTGYHVGYYLRDKNLSLFEDAYNNRDEIKELYKTKEDLIKQILNVNINDHQHWHLGATLTWTPFKDLDLTKIILRLNEDDLIKHILDADINKQIIRRVYPECLELLSSTKNTNSREHLEKLYNI